MIRKIVLYKYFASVSFTADGDMHNAMYVAVSRYKEHCKQNLFWKPAEVWSTLFENDGKCFFLPIDCCIVVHTAYEKLMLISYYY